MHLLTLKTKYFGAFITYFLWSIKFLPLVLDSLTDFSFDKSISFPTWSCASSPPYCTPIVSRHFSWTISLQAYKLITCVSPDTGHMITAGADLTQSRRKGHSGLTEIPSFPSSSWNVRFVVAMVRKNVNTQKLTTASAIFKAIQDYFSLFTFLLSGD